MGGAGRVTKKSEDKVSHCYYHIGGGERKVYSSYIRQEGRIDKCVRLNGRRKSGRGLREKDTRIGIGGNAISSHLEQFQPSVVGGSRMAER